ncbi:hypothetical protein EJ04DRAFT_510624 [Polyplosphaeria fusca]|uniref:TFIIE beta domain-containing protein n=1 Tax=Polyplosphaeria fusca TaxID=682080 RepID=A0A9P4R0R5_9PLEO|nr:hypothetical protein EJ04DRAFT_510624 [Polyplosphaeria fusca]
MAANLKRKREDIVHSQPLDTGSGSHIYTQLTYSIDFLRQSPDEWYSLTDLFNHLNIINDPDINRTKSNLENLYKHPRTENIEYNYSTNKYRYRPKYNIRDADGLKHHLQNQKSAQGLPVRELKDGWQSVQGDLGKLEKSQEILVTRTKKDNQAKTVWLNDASLMHKMDEGFKADWHDTKLPNVEELRNTLLKAGLKPSSAPKEFAAAKPKEKKRKQARRGGKMTNTHMSHILKDYSERRK